MLKDMRVNSKVLSSAMRRWATAVHNRNLHMSAPNKQVMELLIVPLIQRTGLRQNMQLCRSPVLHIPIRQDWSLSQAALDLRYRITI